MKTPSRKRIIENSDDLLEKLSELEHNQWVFYSKNVATLIQRVNSLNDLDQAIIKWHKNWIPYTQLSEKEKDKDRIWARKVLRTMSRMRKSKFE